MANEVTRVERKAGLVATLLTTQTPQTLVLTLLAPVVPMISSYFGDGHGAMVTAQLIAVMPFLGLALGGAMSGVAVHAIGLRRLALLASMMFAAGGLVGTLTEQASLLLAGCLLIGFGAGFIISSLSAITSLVYRDEMLARMVGYQTALGSFVAAILAISTAFAAERFGWRTPFATYAAVGLLILVMSLRFLPLISVEDADVRRDRLAVLKTVGPVCLVGALACGLAATQSTQLPFLMARNGVTSAGIRATILTWTLCCGTIGSLFYSRSQAFVGNRGLIAIATSLAVAGWLLFSFWTIGLILAFVGAAMLGGAIGIVLPSLFQTVLEAVPSRDSGQAAGLLNASTFLGSFLNPLLTTPLQMAFGFHGLFVALAGMSLAIGIVVLLYRTSSRRSERVNFKP